MDQVQIVSPAARAPYKPSATLPGAKLLKKFEQNFYLANVCAHCPALGNGP